MADIYPVGAVIAVGASSIANDLWLPCDGRLVSKAKHTELFEVFQYEYGGSGDEFGLPDYRGRFLRGTPPGEKVGKVEDWTTKKPGTPFTGAALWLPDKQEHCNLVARWSCAGDGGALPLTACTAGGDKETRSVNVYVDYYVKVQRSVGS